MKKKLLADHLGRAFVVVSLLVGHGVSGGQAETSVPPLTEAEMHVWTTFTAGWNRSQETDHTVAELRAMLPGVSTGDVAWVLAERQFNDDMLATTHSTPEQLLLDMPHLRLAGRAVGQAAALHHQWPEVLIRTPDGKVRGGTRWELSLTEEQLWTALGHHLGDDLASFRSQDKVPFTDLLWVHIAQNLDRGVWEEARLTASEMLSSPDYGLARKMLTDRMTEAILIDCIPEHGGVGPVFCKYSTTSTTICAKYSAWPVGGIARGAC